jgi:hypothetical protein
MDMRSRLFAVLARLDTVELPTASLYSGAVHTRCHPLQPTRASPVLGGLKEALPAWLSLFVQNGNN